MPITSVRATTKKIPEKNVVSCESREFSFNLEQTAERGGINSAMNPMEAMLCSLGSCITLVASNYAKNNNIALRDIWVELEGDFDTDGMTMNNVKSGYSNIRCKIHLDTDASSDQVNALMNFIKNKAPVVDTIQSGVKIQMENVVMASTR